MAADRQPAGHRRDGHPNVYADSIEWDESQPGPPRLDHSEPAPAQRPGNCCCRSRIGLPGRCRPHRGVPVRQWRAHRQRLSGDAGVEPVLPRRGSADRLLQHRRDPPDRGALQPTSGARTSPLRRRPGLHRVLRQPSGCDQQGSGRHEDRRRRGRRRRRGHPVAGALSADRSQGRRPHLRGRHPGELAIRQGRGGLHHGRPTTAWCRRDVSRSSSAR